MIERDVLAMSTICPFQINALGRSPFCDIFEEKEWMDFNYVRDLGSYYGSGYYPILYWPNLVLEIPMERSWGNRGSRR